MKSSSPAFAPIVAELMQIDNELDQFDFLCMRALTAACLPAEEKTESSRIAACDSKLWCVLKTQGGCLLMQPDSDSLLVKGIALLLKETAESRSLTELALEPLTLSQYLYEQGIIDEKRKSGMREMEQRICQFASDALRKSECVNKRCQ